LCLELNPLGNLFDSRLIEQFPLTQTSLLGSICCPVSDFYNLRRELPAVVFVNPHAGGGRAQRRLASVKALFCSRSFPAEFILTESANEMQSRVHAVISAGRRLLLAMGGDGTLQCLVNAARESEALLGVIPAGGGNDFAAELGLPKDPIAAAEAILSGQPRCVDVLRARTADGRERLYLGGGGIGLDADAALYSSGPCARLPGRLRYLASALRAFREFEGLRIRAEFPGSNLPAMDGPVLLAGVLNTPSYGAGLRLAPSARIDDGLLTTLFVKHLSTSEVLAALPRLLARGDLTESYVTRVSAPRVRLAADRKCLFHGDGEVLGPAPVEVDVLPKAVRMLAPARS
jgi:diacylglycerol kinase (ATP)